GWCVRVVRTVALAAYASHPAGTYDPDVRALRDLAGTDDGGCEHRRRHPPSGDPRGPEHRRRAVDVLDVSERSRVLRQRPRASMGVADARERALRRDDALVRRAAARQPAPDGLVRTHSVSRATSLAALGVA